MPEEKLKDVTVASLISQLSPSNESKPRDNNFSEQSPNDNQLSKRTSFVRASFGRMSLRSRQNQTPAVESLPKAGMAKSKTMGRDEVLQVKSMNMPQRASQAPKVPNAASVRPRMLRSNTALSSSDLEGMNLKNKTQQSNVCLSCKDCLVETIRTMSMKCRETRKIIPRLNR